jgi:hypothetical protein
MAGASPDSRGRFRCQPPRCRSPRPRGGRMGDAMGGETLSEGRAFIRREGARRSMGRSPHSPGAWLALRAAPCRAPAPAPAGAATARLRMGAQQAMTTPERVALMCAHYAARAGGRGLARCTAGRPATGAAHREHRGLGLGQARSMAGLRAARCRRPVPGASRPMSTAATAGARMADVLVAQYAASTAAFAPFTFACIGIMALDLARRERRRLARCSPQPGSRADASRSPMPAVRSGRRRPRPPPRPPACGRGCARRGRCRISHHRSGAPAARRDGYARVTGAEVHAP